MEWLENLLFNPDSIAHIVLLYSLVISLGVLLGRVRIFGVSLGVTFILFVGILMGHFGFTGNLQIINFVQNFGLILFVFCIGLQVGRSVLLLQFPQGRSVHEPHGCGCNPAEHRRNGRSVAVPVREGGSSDDGGSPVRCCHKHP